MTALESDPGHLRYMPKLDGLRALAIGLVLLQHFGPEPFASAIASGAVGVKLFFVLSGFLITAVLLGLREADMSRPEAAARFYWRRILRLTPALYAAIAAAVLLGVGLMRQDWWWHALYLSNVLVVVRQTFGPVGHFWTLAVEEQFYLLWSLLALFLPRRALIPAVAGFILLGPAYRLALAWAGVSSFAQVLLPGNIDGLALGALLALSHRHGAVWRMLSSPWVLAASAAAAGGLLLPAAPDLARRVVFPSLVFLASASAVAIGSKAGGGAGVRWLEATILRHIGTISYGIYVYHYFLPLIAARWVPAVANAPGPLRAGIYVAASLAVAEVSWRFLEQPIRRLRDRRPAAPARRAEPA
ncbi:acyltransferase [Phenylobacterium sp.]|uniref:acyltransferase family protein n=1 Tax=Phenylobacterium sp. TaxID=1871053 RepID=UPI001229575F|nr:acyltransferase [Phenylobacterium sp.]THD62626.1 MAG: acyltransferase [Phenylobacterium sp.]